MSAIRWYASIGAGASYGIAIIAFFTDLTGWAVWLAATLLIIVAYSVVRLSHLTRPQPAQPPTRWPSVRIKHPPKTTSMRKPRPSLGNEERAAMGPELPPDPNGNRQQRRAWRKVHPDWEPADEELDES